MKYFRPLFLGVLALVISSCCTEREQKVFDYHVCAFIWPSCHDDSLGRTNWEEGIGEWEVIKKGDPRFPGHLPRNASQQVKCGERIEIPQG